MDLKPIDLLNKSFRLKVRGYDPSEVHQFLHAAATELERLLAENIGLKEQVESLEAEVGRYRDVERTLNNALVLAQKTAEEVMANARKEADLVMREARSKAERDLGQTQKELEELRKTRDRFAIEFRALLQSCLEICEGSQGGERKKRSSGK